MKRVTFGKNGQIMAPAKGQSECKSSISLTYLCACYYLAMDTQSITHKPLINMIRHSKSMYPRTKPQNISVTLPFPNHVNVSYVKHYDQKRPALMVSHSVYDMNPFIALHSGQNMTFYCVCTHQGSAGLEFNRYWRLRRYCYCFVLCGELTGDS